MEDDLRDALARIEAKLDRLMPLAELMASLSDGEPMSLSKLLAALAGRGR